MAKCEISTALRGQWTLGLTLLRAGDQGITVELSRPQTSVLRGYVLKYSHELDVMASRHLWATVRSCSRARVLQRAACQFHRRVVTITTGQKLFRLPPMPTF